MDVCVFPQKIFGGARNLELLPNSMRESRNGFMREILYINIHKIILNKRSIYLQAEKTFAVIVPDAAFPTKTGKNNFLSFLGAKIPKAKFMDGSIWS